MQTLTRTYPDGTRATYALQPGSAAAEALSRPIKPHKLPRKADKRLFPAYVAGVTSTADYVRDYFSLNTRPYGKISAYANGDDSLALYAPLPDEPAAVYQGLDTVEEVEEIEDALRAAESMRVKLPDSAWNGDRGEWVTVSTIEEIYGAAAIAAVREG